MNEANTKNAILYCIERAANQEIQLGKTRLIKLLYLLDIENYRLKQEVFTDLRWIFYKFGPYAFEIEPFLDKIGIEEEDVYIGRGKIISRLQREIEAEEVELGIEVKAIIERLVEMWGTADLNELLDFVYFETEPMSKIEFMQDLDISKVVRVQPESKIELSNTTKEKLKERGKRIKNRLNALELPDDPFIRIPMGFITDFSFLKEEVKDLEKLTGKVKVKDA